MKRSRSNVSQTQRLQRFHLKNSNPSISYVVATGKASAIVTASALPEAFLPPNRYTHLPNLTFRRCPHCSCTRGCPGNPSHVH